MSTKQVTQQTNAFDPQALAAYHNLIGGLGPMVSDWMNPNIANTNAFRIQLGQNMGAANTLGQGFFNNLMQNAKASSGSAMSLSPYLQSMLAYGGRNQSALRAQAFQNAYLSGIGRQQFGAQLASGFRPLQTGGTQTQTMSGLGTWLPQLAIAGASIGLAPFTGGMSLGGLSALNAAGPGGQTGLGSILQNSAGTQPGSAPMSGWPGPGPGLTPPGGGW